MNALIRPLLIAVIVMAPVATATAADKVKVEGKQLITKLFNDAIVTAGQSTVSLRYNSKVIILGTIVTPDGYILTKGSDLMTAMKKPADEDGLVARLKDGARHPAKVIGYHEKTDLALLKIDATDLVAVTFVDSKLAEAGNMVASPGMETKAIAAGIISVGVRTLHNQEAEVDNGNKGYLGISVDNRRTDGVFIREVNTRSPAKNKLKENDQIVSIDDRTITKFEEMRKILGGFAPGDKIKVLIRRKKAADSDDTEEIQLEIKLTSQTTIDRGAFQNSLGSELSGRRTGFPKVITHDMVIEPDECGGPLVDIEGRVLGINIARAGRVETWALPPEVIKPVIADLKAGKFPISK